MELKPRSYVYTRDYFERYNLDMFDLLCGLTYQDKDKLTDLEKGNLVIDAIYSVLANYTTFMYHIDEVRRSDLVHQTPPEALEVAITKLEKHCDHVYLMYPESIFASDFDPSELNPTLNGHFYDVAISEACLETEVYDAVDKTMVMNKIIEDIIVDKLLKDCSDFAGMSVAVPVYINLVSVNKDQKALHIVIFEPVEREPL